MKLVLIDRMQEMEAAWRAEWEPPRPDGAPLLSGQEVSLDGRGFPELVEFRTGNILSVAEGALVSPANSLGRMDGGIDLVYINYFGMGLQERVLTCIETTANGFLDVGSARVVETGHSRITHLIVAPTMEGPQPIDDPKVVGRAMWAILREAYARRSDFDVIFCPGLGTGVGHMAPEDAAHEMIAGIRDFRKQHPIA